MKTMRFLCVGLFLLAGMVGCRSKTAGTVAVTTTVSIDTTDSYDITVRKPSFTGSSERLTEQLIPLNRHIDSMVGGWKDTLRKNAEELDAFLSNAGESVSFTCQLYVKDSIYWATDRLVSLQLIVYTYMGGAHGSTDFYAVNYDVRQQRFLSDEELLDFNRSQAVDSLLKAHFANPDSCFWDQPTLWTAACLNETAEGVVFTYPQYVLGPYSCGYVLLEIPKEELKTALVWRP